MVLECINTSVIAYECKQPIRQHIESPRMYDNSGDNGNIYAKLVVVHILLGVS
ncbi:MAG: hypothetical protein WAK17_28400 [Candidatus Nitrosopolaris sp.]|jgi:hypothetical protein